MIIDTSSMLIGFTDPVNILFIKRTNDDIPKLAKTGNLSLAYNSFIPKPNADNDLWLMIRNAIG